VLDSHAVAARFEAHRPQLLAVATRLLGSPTEAEDAVQEAWLRLDRHGIEGIDNLGGWLTTVVSRICLDHLRSRSTRSEEPIDPVAHEFGDDGPGPEDAAMLAESTVEALGVVLDTLSPIERVAFVLHDVFDVPFEQIAAIVDRSPAATRQLASRARRRVQAASSAGERRVTVQREIVTAFFAASREGHLDALISLLAPDVVLRTDAVTAAMGGVAPEVLGAEAVANVFSGRAQATRLATIDGFYGATWAPGGKPRVAFRFTVSGGVIVAIDLIGDPTALSAMEIVIIPK
jgi:RNA polymerase sigma-70 factor (ECF subfamily)